MEVRKLGKGWDLWVINLIYPICKLTIDPKFLGHPSKMDAVLGRESSHNIDAAIYPPLKQT